MGPSRPALLCLALSALGCAVAPARAYDSEEFERAYRVKRQEQVKRYGNGYVPPVLGRFVDEDRETGLARIGSRVPVRRREINDLLPPQRAALVKAILEYLTDDVVLAHATKVSHVKQDLFTHHDAYILDMELFLKSHGHAEMLPLPVWNPARPIPREFWVVKPKDDGTPRRPITLPDLWRPVETPETFRYPAVCRYKTDAELGEVVGDWHGGIHVALGGCMEDFEATAGAPLFWLWHAYVSSIREGWKPCLFAQPSPYATRN